MPGPPPPATQPTSSRPAVVGLKSGPLTYKVIDNIIFLLSITFVCAKAALPH